MRNEAWIATALIVAGVAAGCGERGHPKTPPSVTSSTVAAPATDPAELPKAWYPVDRQGEQAMRDHQESIRKQQDERREQVLRARAEQYQHRRDQKQRPPRPRPTSAAAP